MAKYDYQGEVFQVEDTGDCQLTVSDSKNAASIRHRAAGTVYQVWIESTYWNASTLEQAIDIACRELIALRTRPSADEVCKEMSEFVKNLESD